jgi:cyclic pyranopterin phosphate synthase
VTRKLSHLDETGQAHMVDVGAKPVTVRTARAEGRLKMGAGAYALARAGDLPKGDLLTQARVAAILAAKQTPHLIPLCHPVALTRLDVDFRWQDREHAVVVETAASARDATGVEMEAMVACGVACLALYDMVKGVDRAASIGPVRLLEKTGGKSGRFQRR